MKIVYNACYGGFSLSRRAVECARQLTGDPNWGGATIKGDRYPDGKKVDLDYGYVNVPRHDPILVEVVEKLGDAANGESARLRIADVPFGARYRIDEYDGNEVVMTPDDYEWQVAE